MHRGKMNSTEWENIKQVFLTAFDMPEQQRDEYLAECDEHVRIKVEKLLKADKSAKNFIVESAVVDAGLVGETERDPFVDGNIDGYTIIREIGQGGMGTVYLAQRSDESFDKTVALKLVKRGMDTNAVLKRFVMERSILAQLEHPNIAGLIDGGTTPDGLPYFVMEYVDGQPVTKYCGANALSIRERLELFQKVCAAVSYAHANLVVHRDVKPSNILVTQDGTPKLLDFGIAKLLHPDWSLDTAEATATMFRILTPEYASPEQIRGLAVTTASDVYSLGIVLYELLCGERPYKIDSRLSDEVAREILIAEPIKPSSVVSGQWPVIGKTTKTDRNSTDENKENDTYGVKPFRNPHSAFRNLEGDLDNIVLKAIRKDPERRYASVQEFSEDIRRHLAGLPVTATADTKIYRLKKFAKRHSAGVAAGCLILLTLITATAITGWQAVVARRERDRAEQRFNQVRKLAKTVLFEYDEGIASLPGSTSVREKMIKDSLEYLDNLSAESAENLSLLSEVAAAYQKAGDIQGNPYYANLGDMNGAFQSYQKALAIREELATLNPNDTLTRDDLADSYSSVADIYWGKGDYTSALEFYNKALMIAVALVNEEPEKTSNKENLAGRYYNVGQTLRKTGDFPGALESFQKSLDINQAMVSVEPGNTRYSHALATSYLKIGDVYFDAENYVEALPYHQKAADLYEPRASNKEDALSQRTYSLFLQRVASDKRELGDSASAIDLQLKAFTMLKKLLDADPENEQYRLDMATLYQSLGSAYIEANKLDDAAVFLRKAIVIFTESQEKNPDREAQQDLAITYRSLGDCLTKAGKTSEAKDAYIKGK